MRLNDTSSASTTDLIPTSLSSNRQSQQQVTTQLNHSPISEEQVTKDTNYVVSNSSAVPQFPSELLSALSMEQLSRNVNSVAENPAGEAPDGFLEDTNGEIAEDAEIQNPVPINSQIASKHALSDMILNQEIPGYSGGAGLLAGTRWRPGFDYHPHTNIHETLQFLHRYYDKLKGLSNTTNDATSIYFTPSVSSAAVKTPSNNPSDTRSGAALSQKVSRLRSNVQKNEAETLPPKATVAVAGAVPSARSFPVYEDYSDRQLTQLIHCPNQTTCLSPVLQLQRPYNVYFCKHIANGVRFYYLVREGLLLHPQIHLIEDMFAADVIVYLPESARWHRSECRDPRVRHKMVVLDESDGPQIFVPPVEEDAKFLATVTDNNKHPPSSTHKLFLLYFKRSYVRRENGVFGGYMNYVTRNLDVLPMFYPVATAYLRHPVLPHTERDLEIVCSLRGSNWDPTRQRIKEWTQEYVRARGIPKDKVRVGEVNSESRTTVSKGYFQAMYSSKIVVTSNPSHWEGDFRLMEAMASAALVFVDNLYVPRPSIPLHNQHIVYYDNMDKAGFFSLLDTHRAGFARQAPEKAADARLSRISQSVIINTSANKNTKAEAASAVSGSRVQFLRGSADTRRRLWTNDTASYRDHPKSNNGNSSHLNHHHQHHLPYYSESHRDDEQPSSRRYLAAEVGTLSESERIAYRGYIHSLRFLRTDALIDYIFRTLHIFELENSIKNAASPRHMVPTERKANTHGRQQHRQQPHQQPQEQQPVAPDMVEAMPSAAAANGAASLPLQSPSRLVQMHFAQPQDENIVTPREEVQEGNPVPKDEMSEQEEVVTPPRNVAKRMKKRGKDRAKKGFGRTTNDAAMMKDFGIEIRSTRRLFLDSTSASGSLDAIGRIDPSQRKYRVSQDREYGSSALYGYNAEHGFAMRWRAIPTNGNPTKPTGVIAPGSAKGSDEILATFV
jgi:hypothetical protein